MQNDFPKQRLPSECIIEKGAGRCICCFYINRYFKSCSTFSWSWLLSRVTFVRPPRLAEARHNRRRRCRSAGAFVFLLPLTFMQMAFKASSLIFVGSNFFFTKPTQWMSGERACTFFRDQWNATAEKTEIKFRDDITSLICRYFLNVCHLFFIFLTWSIFTFIPFF